MNSNDFILNLLNPKLLQTLQKDETAMYDIKYQIDRILENYEVKLDENQNMVIASSNGNPIKCDVQDIKLNSGEVVGATLIFEPVKKVSFFDSLFANSYRLSFLIDGPRLSGLKLMFDIKRIEKENEELCVTNIYNCRNNITSCDSNIRRFDRQTLEMLEKKALISKSSEPFQDIYEGIYNIRKKVNNMEFMNCGNGISVPQFVSDQLDRAYIYKSVHIENCSFNKIPYYELTIYDLINQRKPKYEANKILLLNRDKYFQYRNPKALTSVVSCFLDKRYLECKHIKHQERGKVLQK